ncbi:hypothetical protein LI90_2276 [Carbonactinospora thermoautotrophica]|uniref:Uncharacterized protein n=1 Tax=Carbonactinospora thermoautotrophica TaxID=1469144 RepID=A0A132MTL7_9ACTN|nr:hypothetical protein [Carbonactinospora thermoautotrophica]KWX01248.1 hypothetical protein LI90_2276 [Carbonactinospora thermoautotrophica]
MDIVGVRGSHSVRDVPGRAEFGEPGEFGVPKRWMVTGLHRLA